MSEFSSYNVGGGEVRRAHLALVEGGASTSSTKAAAPTTGTRVDVATAYSRAAVESPRTRHDAGVRAVARNYETFEDALIPMVLASGVTGEQAAAVAQAILGNPALRAQAERAFQRARIDAV